MNICVHACVCETNLSDGFAKFWFSFIVESGDTLGLRSSLGTQRVVELHSAVQLVLTKVSC